MSSGIERLQRVFAERTRPVLVPYITAGDPDLATTEQLLDALVAGGADIIELGVPFSDPMADGPVIQLAAERALQSPFGIDELLEVVARFRQRHDTPVILFGYYNPYFRYGHERLAAAAARAGVCGALCVDLPPEEAGPFHAALRTEGLALIPLLTPVSDGGRVDAARAICDAFGYYVSVTGVTGLSLEGRGSIAERVAEVRGQLDRPLVVGFGVRTPEDAARMAQGADGVVVGTALVDLAHRTAAAERTAAVTTFISGLAGALGH